MFRGKESVFVTIICAAGMGTFVALWLLDFALIRTEWCSGAEMVCFREWISALSGWAAALAAIATIIFTIGPLRGQLNEAKRQTDFSVGDAEPEIIVQRNRSKDRVSLLIVNWNRRRIMIEGIETTSNMNGLTVHNTLAADERYPSKTKLFNPPKKRTSYGVDGWRDRANPPEERTIALSFALHGEVTEKPASTISIIELKVHFRLVGQTHARRNIISKAIEIID